MGRVEILPGANRREQPFWAEFIFALDRRLQRRQGVFEYSLRPDCIFRAQISRLCSEVLLSDGTFGRPGDRVIDLHFWNEQIPATIAGYSLAWGCRFNRSFAESIRELARFLMREPELTDISIIRANINLDTLHRIAARYGFEAILEPVRLSPSECVHRFGENILYWLLTCVQFGPRSAEQILAKSAGDISFSEATLAAGIPRPQPQDNIAAFRDGLQKCFRVVLGMAHHTGR